MPDDPDVQPSSEGDDPLAELQARFSSSLDGVQMMLDRVADVLAPLDTLPELDGPSEGGFDGVLARTLEQLAEPADAASQADGFDARQLDRAIAGAVDEVAGSAASRAAHATALPQRRGRSPSSTAAASGGGTGLEPLPLEQQPRHADSPPARLIERQLPSSTADTSLDQIARALAAGPADANGGGATRVTFPQSPLTTATSAVGSGRVADQRAGAGPAGNRRTATASIPQLQLPGAPGRSPRGRGADDSSKLLRELQEGQQQLLRDVAELKRRPATWGGGR